MVSTVHAIELRLPADAAFLSVTRMFSGSVAKTFGLDPERTQDLRLALSEICAAVVEGHHPDPSTLAVGVSWDDTSLRFTCSGLPLAVDGVRWMLIQALMPDVQADGANGSITFSIER